MIETILIANRGEIACRIIKTCRRLGINTAAVFSDIDARALHVALADIAVHIGPSPAPESYLNIGAIMNAALLVGVDAIHPGFGFLAENSEFARACSEAGLIFIGPHPEAIEIMGDKKAAKALMAQNGIPIIPGYDGQDQSLPVLQKEASRLGFPVMVKAIAGGGGKGMRIVSDPADFHAAIDSARNEALQAFGSDLLMLERPLSDPRHIEFQVFGDHRGNIIHLGERECSIQRRFQKVIEETPSLALNPELRQRMGETAVVVARAIDYTNAGTVEFLLDEDNQFYFLEMNTRLQVEHPVTEMITGLDLVEWQIRVAGGEPLPLTQQALSKDGHAIEVRIYAEDPANEFLPSTGQILLWREPEEENIRLDCGIQTGDEVSVYYDPMLAKLIAWGEDRKTAVRCLTRALDKTILFGVKNNLAYLKDLLRHPAFIAGELNTHFIPIHFSQWQAENGEMLIGLITATLAQFIKQQDSQAGGYWRNNPNRPQIYRYQLTNDSEPKDVSLIPDVRFPNKYMIRIKDIECIVLVNDQQGADWILTIGGLHQKITAVSNADQWWVKTRTGIVTFQSVPLLPEPKQSANISGSLRAPMPGSVLAVLVEVGQQVSKGQPLMKLEAMKMEHTIRTTADGVVEVIYFNPGDIVEADAQLLRIGPVRND